MPSDDTEGEINHTSLNKTIYSLATKTNITWRNRLFLIGYVTAYKVADALIQPTNFCVFQISNNK